MDDSQFQLLKDIATVAVFPLMGFMYWYLTYRNSRKSGSTADARYVENLAIEVKAKADQLAVTLKELDAKVASKVRESIEDYVNSAIERLETHVDNSDKSLKAEMESGNKLIYAELRNMMTMITDIIKDVTNMSGSAEKGGDKLEKKLAMLEQFTYGTRTKSDNPMFSDTEETEEHKKEEAPSGSIFEDTKEEAEERAEGKVQEDDKQKNEPPEPDKST
jgi:hypothetical protein